MGKRGYVKNVNLLSTILIPLSKIVVRVGEGVFNVYLSKRRDLEGIGGLWKAGDAIWCLKHQWKGCVAWSDELLVTIHSESLERTGVSSVFE